MPDLKLCPVPKHFKYFEEEMYAKFYAVFFSAEFSPEIISKNLKSLCSICEIISTHSLDSKHMDNVSNVIAALLMRTDAVNIICENLDKIIKVIKNRINISIIRPHVEAICSWTKEEIESKDKSGVLLKTMHNFLGLILMSIDCSSQ